MSEPIVYADQWRHVMKAAGWRCQCTGQCGIPHIKGEGRCVREHDRHASKHRSPIHLIAAPAEPTTPPLAAARLGARDLRAWCPDCHTAASRAARKTRASEPAQDTGLFDL
ncbi:hypothetical protein ACFVFQ_25000 [Streptomyces sp. NPDC057743]|uniref:hypothetical protein n=1 Tax=Streptomyces sp. NPDC057743 TaxID=3346236 RepID=UPI00368D217E